MVLGAFWFWFHSFDQLYLVLNLVCKKMHFFIVPSQYNLVCIVSMFDIILLHYTSELKTLLDTLKSGDHLVQAKDALTQQKTQVASNICYQAIDVIDPVLGTNGSVFN